MFYASFFFFLSSKSIPRKVSSKILIQDFIRLNELMSFGMIYYAWSRDDKYPQVPQDLSAHLAGYLGFACRSGSTSTFIYSFFFFLFLFFLHSIQRPFRLTWRGFERIVLDIPILPDDPPTRDYRGPKTVLVSSRFLVKLLESTKRTPCSVVELTGFQLWLREMKYVFDTIITNRGKIKLGDQKCRLEYKWLQLEFTRESKEKYRNFYFY